MTIQEFSASPKGFYGALHLHLINVRVEIQTTSGIVGSKQGHILTGEQCGEACNWWEDAEQDFMLAEQMENNALRLSIEWSRIEPAEGLWDSGAETVTGRCS